MRKVFRLYPENDAFEIQGVFLPYLDVIADDEEAAIRAVAMLIPGYDTHTDFVHEIKQRNTKIQ
jgi:hypothetical protein